MKLEIHALRFCEDDSERAKKHVFNKNPAVIEIAPGSEVTISAKDNMVSIIVGNDPPTLVFLGPWDHTAVALVVDRMPEG